MTTSSTDWRAQKWFGLPPKFDPEEGNVVAEPPGSGYGFWAGAPSAVFDFERGKFYCYYRRRWPLAAGRGGECCIAESDDALNWRVIWTAKKDDFRANSIEKASLIKDPSGEWRLYIGFEVAQAYDRNPPAWRVSLMQAPTPDAFDPMLERPVMDGPMYGFSFVKDPCVYVIGGQYHAYASVALPRQHEEPDEGGVIRTRGRGWSALMTSSDGIDFPTAKIVFGPGPGWDSFQRRISSLVYLPPVWVAFYDGARHRADGYDEFCGLAVTHDLVNFTQVSTGGPWVQSPHASGCIRYLDAIVRGNEIHYFYEYARPDRGHELRHNCVPLA